jgi:ABC-type polysaccharide/polyol phosphate export permease
LGQLFLFKELVKRDFQSRYVGSLLGVLWAFLLPLWQLFLYSFVFSTVMRIPLTGQRTENFAVFLFCGLLPWMAINDGLVRSATAITDNATLVKKSRFRLEILLLAVITTGILHELIAGAVFAVYLGATGELGWRGLPLLLLALPLQVGLTLGVGLILCSVHTLFRDTAQFIGLALTGWFFLTPIVYPLQQAPEPYRSWLEWNPLTVLVTIYRQALLADQPAWVDGTGRLALTTAVVLGVGVWFFRRLSRTFVDEI